MSLVTYLNDDVMCRTQTYSFTFVSLLLRPTCLSWDFGGKGQHFPYHSLAVCLHLTNSVTQGYRLVLKILILQ